MKKLIIFILGAISLINTGCNGMRYRGYGKQENVVLTAARKEEVQEKTYLKSFNTTYGVQTYSSGTGTQFSGDDDSSSEPTASCNGVNDEDSSSDGGTSDPGTDDDSSSAGGIVVANCPVPPVNPVPPTEPPIGPNPPINPNPPTNPVPPIEPPIGPPTDPVPPTNPIPPTEPPIGPPTDPVPPTEVIETEQPRALLEARLASVDTRFNSLVRQVDSSSSDYQVTVDQVLVIKARIKSRIQAVIDRMEANSSN